jgi:hypothetical protein
VGWRIRREIIIETEEILVLRKSRLIEKWCLVCSERVAHCTLRDAALVSGKSLSEMIRCLQSGSLHGAENSGHWLICLHSISKQKSIKGEL